MKEEAQESRVSVCAGDAFDKKFGNKEKKSKLHTRIFINSTE